MTDGFEQRYTRNFNTLSPADQARLGNTHVAVIGLGGLGGPVCELLARTGIGTLTLVDGDVFEASNLNRQVLSREDNMGRSKANEAQKRIQAINSSVKVNVHPAFASKDNIRTFLKDADLAVDCLDTINDRFLLQAAARTLDIPLVSGAIAGVCGQVTVMYPQDPGFELIYPDGGNKTQSPERGIETQVGNLSFCAMCVASIQAAEVVKVVTGNGDTLRNKLLFIDLWTHTTEVMDLL